MADYGTTMPSSHSTTLSPRPRRSGYYIHSVYFGRKDVIAHCMSCTTGALRCGAGLVDMQPVTWRVKLVWEVPFGLPFATARGAPNLAICQQTEYLPFSEAYSRTPIYSRAWRAYFWQLVNKPTSLH